MFFPLIVAYFVIHSSILCDPAFSRVSCLSLVFPCFCYSVCVCVCVKCSLPAALCSRQTSTPHLLQISSSPRQAPAVFKPASSLHSPPHCQFSRVAPCYSQAQCFWLMFPLVSFLFGHQPNYCLCCRFTCTCLAQLLIFQRTPAWDSLPRLLCVRPPVWPSPLLCPALQWSEPLAFFSLNINNKQLLLGCSTVSVSEFYLLVQHKAHV